MGEPQETIEFTLAEGLDLLAALEDARELFSQLIRHERLTVADTPGAAGGCRASDGCGAP